MEKCGGNVLALQKRSVVRFSRERHVVPVRTQGTVANMGPVMKAGVKDKGLPFFCIG